MIQTVPNPIQGAPPVPPAYRAERNAMLTVARRMFDEGFKKSTILRITGLEEEDFVGMIRDLHRSIPSMA